MFYKKGIDITNAKQMFEFLKGHYMYYTMRSWNQLKSIANNVKLHSLGLDGDWCTARRYLEDNQYFNVNMMIEDWEAEHKGYRVGFNGSQDGYLVLYSKHSNGNILPDIIADNDYESFKEDCKRYYGGVKYYLSELRAYTKLVQDFDKLCDEIRNYVNELSLRSFTDDKVEVLLDDFVYVYKDDLGYAGLDIPSLVESNAKEILLSIDPEMRKWRALMNCFFKMLRTDYWTILDDGSTTIRLAIC